MRLFVNKMLYTLSFFAFPTFAIVLWHIPTNLDGSFSIFSFLLKKHGFVLILLQLWWSFIPKTIVSWLISLLFICGQIILMEFGIAGKKNGIFSLFITCVIYLLFSYVFNIFSPSVVYNYLGEILGIFTLLSICVWLTLKNSKYFLKHMVNLRKFVFCRMGMMLWAVVLISSLFAQQEAYGLTNSMVVCCLLQFFYIVQFFVSEQEYVQITNCDISFHSCWLRMVFIPIIYLSVPLYLVSHPTTIHNYTAVLILLAGAACTVISYLKDIEMVLLALANKPMNLLFGAIPVFLWTLPACFCHFYPLLHIFIIFTLLIKVLLEKTPNLQREPLND